MAQPRDPQDAYLHAPLGLPVDLQYLPPDKQREPDADIRKMLIEAIMLVSRGPRSPPNTCTPAASAAANWLVSAPSLS